MDLLFVDTFTHICHLLESELHLNFALLFRLPLSPVSSVLEKIEHCYTVDLVLEYLYDKPLTSDVVTLSLLGGASDIPLHFVSQTNLTLSPGLNHVSLTCKVRDGSTSS